MSEAIAAFCQTEQELQRGQQLLKQAKRPLLESRRQAKAELHARLRQMKLRAANVRVGDQCWKLKETSRRTRRAVTPAVIKQAVGAEGGPAASDSPPTTMEELERWVWEHIQDARTSTKQVLSITASQTDLSTVLPPEAHLPELGAGGTPEERDAKEETTRYELQALLAQHNSASDNLNKINRENREAKQLLREQSVAAQPHVLRYMEERNVSLQPIRLGDEQFNMRRRTTTRVVAPTKAADVQALIRDGLRALFPDAFHRPDYALTPEDLALCTGAAVAQALCDALPRKQDTKVSLLRKKGPKKCAEEGNSNEHATKLSSEEGGGQDPAADGSDAAAGHAAL